MKKIILILCILFYPTLSHSVELTTIGKWVVRMSDDRDYMSVHIPSEDTQGTLMVICPTDVNATCNIIMIEPYRCFANTTTMYLFNTEEATLAFEGTCKGDLKNGNHYLEFEGADASRIMDILARNKLLGTSFGLSKSNFMNRKYNIEGFYDAFKFLYNTIKSLVPRQNTETDSPNTKEF